MIANARLYGGGGGGDNHDETNYQDQPADSRSATSQDANFSANGERAMRPHRAGESRARAGERDDQQEASKRSEAAGSMPRVVRKRDTANQRERERTKSLNRALELLRSKLPCTEAEKRSKIQALRMAKEYIEFLIANLDQASQAPTSSTSGNPASSEQSRAQFEPQSSSSSSFHPAPASPAQRAGTTTTLLIDNQDHRHPEPQDFDQAHESQRHLGQHSLLEAGAYAATTYQAPAQQLACCPHSRLHPHPGQVSSHREQGEYAASDATV